MSPHLPPEASPSLTDAQLKTLELLRKHWEKRHAWPGRVQLMAALRASGFAPDEAFKESYGDLARERGDGTFELTLFGLAATANSAAQTEPFIPLVKRAIDVFLKGPRTRPRIRSDDLRGIATSWTPDDLSAVGPLYRDALIALGSGATTQHHGAWEVELTEKCIRFRSAASVWEYRALKNRSHLPPAVALDPTQRRMALAALEAWRTTGRGPDLLELALKHLDVEDPVGAWETLPEGLFRAETRADGPPLRPNVSGLLALRPESDEDLRALVRILASVHELFSASGDSTTLPIPSVAALTGIAVEDVVRLADLTDSVYRSGIHLNRGVAEPLFSIDENIFGLDGVRTVDDLVAWIRRRDEEKNEWTRRYPAFIADISPTEECSGTSDSAPEMALRAAITKLELHPEIARASSALFAGGHYRNAVLDAALTLVGLVKTASGCGDQDGAALMRTVFSRRAPTLAFNDLADQSDLDEQEGIMHLFEGAVLALRNPRAHAVAEDSPQSALECITLLSLLAKRLDRARRRD